MSERDSAEFERRPRAVLAEDNELVRDVMLRVLERRAAIDVVAVCRDGQEAVTACERLRPDLALLDLRMPRLDGIAATGQIRLLSPGTRIIILSGSESESDRARAAEAGASAYLMKQLDVGSMVAEISRVLAARTDAGS